MVYGEKMHNKKTHKIADPKYFSHLVIRLEDDLHEISFLGSSPRSGPQNALRALRSGVLPSFSFISRTPLLSCGFIVVFVGQNFFLTFMKPHSFIKPRLYKGVHFSTENIFKQFFYSEMS
jgi:hypothetical protein